MKLNLLYKKMLVLTFTVSISLHSMETYENLENLELEKKAQYIDENKGCPKILEAFLIDMAKWKTPDLALAEKILKLSDSEEAKNGGDKYGSFVSTPFEVAACCGKTDYVKFLLDYGANIETRRSWDGRTALMDAALNGHNETLKLLLSRGAHVDAENCYNNTSLIWAAKYGYVEIVKLLIEAEANVHCVNDDGQTALKQAKKRVETYLDAKNHWIQQKDSLKAHGCSQNAKKYKKIITLLVQAGAKD
jgi:hypothetical protein